MCQFSTFLPFFRPDDDFEFIKLTTKWKRGKLFSLEDCTFFNFGYDKPTPFAQIRYDTKTDISLSLYIKGMAASNTCSLVLVAGKYLDNLDKIMEKVDQITKSTGRVPIGVYLFRSYKGQDIKLHNHQR